MNNLVTIKVKVCFRVSRPFPVFLKGMISPHQIMKKYKHKVVSAYGCRRNRSSNGNVYFAFPYIEINKT